MTKSPQPGQQGQSRQSGKNDLDAALVRWTRVVGIFTGLLFIATIGTNIFVGLQWKAAVDAQKDSRIQLGAYVTFAGGRQINNNSGNTTINYIFAPQFRNWGGTRTSHFKGWTSVQYFDGEVPNSQDFSKPYKEVPISDVTIGPGETLPIYVTLPVNDAVKAKDKKGTVIIWGHADWADIYNRDEIGSIYFCLRLVPISSGGDNNIIFEPTPFKSSCNTGMDQAHREN